MRILLAPMEGVVDSTMRAILSGIGGIDLCVTEFLRVTDHLYPEKVFYQRCPELRRQSRTPSGTPVRLQLLGGQPEPVAANAAKAAELGASGIDLNFGCPAKTVNKSDGGACLLRQPHRLQTIVTATRKQVPRRVPVTAKIRLGYEDRSLYLDNALAAYEGGADELTVHARSKADGYKPPAYWEYIAEIREAIPIPVIANGEIWNLGDFQRCLAITGCDSFMLGRGLLACPDLARQIRHWQQRLPYRPFSWVDLCPYLQAFFAETTAAHPAKYTGNRLKQWLHYLSRHYPEAGTLFEQIKRTRDPETIKAAIENSMKHCKPYPLSA